MSKYSISANWVEIEKQFIFEAWVPHVPARPISYFIPDKQANELGKEKGYLTEIIEDTGISTRSAIIKVSRRKIVILTRDEVCKNIFVKDVLIAKIVSIKEDHRVQPWYRDMVNGTHQWFVHLPPEITGVECYINMSQVTTIAKNMLIDKKSQLPEDRMKLVESRYTYGVNLGVIKPTERFEEEESAVNE